MKFKLDENISPSVAAIFAAAGHDAHSIVQQSLAGQPDNRVISVCTSEDRALVTLDLDFSNIQAYPPGNFAGIVVLRLTSQSNAHVEAAVRRMMSVLASEPLRGLLWIVEDHRIRIHE